MLDCYKKAVAVRDLLAAESRWTTGAYARNSSGVECDIDSHNAEKFCLVGAMRHKNALGIFNLMSKLCFETYDMNFAQVNDTLGHEAVMNILDKVVCVAALATHKA